MGSFLLILIILLGVFLCLTLYNLVRYKKHKQEAVAKVEVLKKTSLEKETLLLNTIKELDSQKSLFEVEKKKTAEKNKKLFQMSETVYKEKKKVDEQNTQLELDKEKLAAEKAKVDEKVKKLWTQSMAIHKEKERINELKNEIEHKHQEVMDSVNYAKRIQRALLATEKILNENLPEHFVFFRPKDIVSGDFYCADNLTEDVFSIVAADSTGHGVPGAIMSILNISCLNEATHAQKLLLPNEILDYTRQRIMSHMANDGSEEGGKDGMDAVICNFNFKENLLQFAAANNPLWLIRNNELIEYKPDKMPVGKAMGEIKPFTLQEIKLQKGDLIILLTDGYADQFGGEKGKKFMYKPLKEFIVSINNAPLKDIKNELITTFNNWKGDAEQVDDVLIIGVRV